MSERQLRAALYVRVSRADQNMRQQFAQLRQLAEARGWKVARVFRERRSAFKDRPAHRALMAAASMNRFDVVACWSIDRWARSLVELISTIERLEARGKGERGVKFVSAREPAIDTGSAAGRLILSVLGAAAEFERRRLSERTVMGIEAARRRGSKLGRPPAKGWDSDKAMAWSDEGVSAAEIARRLGVSERTVRRHLGRGKKATGAARGKAA